MFSLIRRTSRGFSFDGRRENITPGHFRHIHITSLTSQLVYEPISHGYRLRENTVFFWKHKSSNLRFNLQLLKYLFEALHRSCPEQMSPCFMRYAIYTRLIDCIILAVRSQKFAFRFRWYFVFVSI